MGILTQRGEVHVDELARELNFSKRTLYRDFSVLQRIGVPLYDEQVGGRRRWRVLDTYKQQLKVTLSWAELLALTTGRELLAGLAGTIFHEAAIRALEKIRAALPEPIVERATAAARHLSASTGARHDYVEQSEVVERLVEAIDRHESVRLSYRKPRARAFEERVIDPYHLHVQAGALYLIGWCHTRQAVRTFLVDRAGKVTPTGQRFEPRPDFAADALVQGSFGPWSGKAETIRIRFSATAGRLVAEHRVHPSQRGQWRSDGKLDVTLQTPLSPALVAWVVGWGVRVDVLAPKKLAELVRREHEEAVRSGSKKGEGV